MVSLHFNDLLEGLPLWPSLGASGCGALNVSCVAARRAVTAFWVQLRELRATPRMCQSYYFLELLASACPQLEALSFLQMNLQLVPSASMAWSLGLVKFPLQDLDLVECRHLSDDVLETIFTNCKLRRLDVSWSSEFSDAPWRCAPATLQDFAGLGCEHLTERVVVHLARRCPELKRLHTSRHLNWIGSTRSELLKAFQEMTCLEDLALQDVPLDDELLMTLSTLPTLQQLELWSFSSDADARCITKHGLHHLACSLKKSLKKLSLDSFVFQGADALQSLSSQCPSLCELLLEGTQPCSLGVLQGMHFSHLVKRRLTSCGVAGRLDCSAMPVLRYLWLFENTALTGIQGAGQALEVLNLGATRCQSVENVQFQRLVMLDLSSLRLADEDLGKILLVEAPRLLKAVIGENFVSAQLLVDFVKNARHLSNLSFCSSDVDAIGHDRLSLLSAWLVERPEFAVNLQLLELFEGSCSLLASTIAVEASPVGGSAILKRGAQRPVRLWVVEQGEAISPYGRIHRADDSWLPVL